MRWVIKSASLIACYFVFVGCTAVNHLNMNYFSLMMVFVVVFAGYISQVLKNYTDHACDGEYVSLRCPHRTTISIQSSFYGRIVPSHQLCPSRYPHSYATLIKEDVACSVGTSLQVLLKCISSFWTSPFLGQAAALSVGAAQTCRSRATQHGSSDVSHSLVDNSSL